MNKKRIESMIPIAMEKLTALAHGGTKLPAEYFGYIASFGPTMTQTGIRQATKFYDSKDGGKKTIGNLVRDVLVKGGRIPAADKGKDLNEIIDAKLNDGDPVDRWKSYLLEAIVACKLSVNTFEKQKKE